MFEIFTRKVVILKMSIILTLYSNSSLIEQSYFPPISLDDWESWSVALVHFSTYNSIPNIDSTNNQLRLGSHVIKIPEGAYEIEELNDFLKAELKQLDSNQTVSIRGNSSTLRTEIRSSLPIHESSLWSLLGFGKTMGPLEANIVHESDSTVEISKVHDVRVDCNIARGSYINSMQSNAIFGFDLSVPPGYKISLNPQSVIYHPVSVQAIDNLMVKIVDQNGHLVNFRGEHITIRLHLKKTS